MINPLDWYDEKFLTYIPVHFTKLKYPPSGIQLEVLEWIYNNVDGRFAIAIMVNASEYDNKTDTPTWFTSPHIENKYIAFENPSDATMFAMCFM